MRRQKSTFTILSPEESTLKQSFDEQHLMLMIPDAPPNWEHNWRSLDSCLYDKLHEGSLLPFESQIINDQSVDITGNQIPWHQFCPPEELPKPQIFATTSDLLEDFSEVSLPVDFNDFNSVEDFEQDDLLSGTNNWHEAVDLYPIPEYSAEDDITFEQYTLPQYPGDFMNTTIQHSLHPRLFLTSFRSTSIMLRHLVSVDVSPEGAIYVHSIPGQSIAVVNDSGDKACIIHPNSRILQEEQNVHVMTHQARLVKICNRGIVFTTNPSIIVYLVDESGTKTTSGKFKDLSRDCSSEVFYGPFYKDYAMRCNDCVSMLANATYQQHSNGDDVWSIGDVQIKQNQFGNIEVSRERNNVLITVLPTAGEISVQTKLIHATVGCYSKRYLSVQKGNCQVSSGFCGLSVQKGTQKAGLDRNGKVVIF